MAPQRKAQDKRPADEQAPRPPYYIADQALNIEHVRAFNVGDMVPAEHVEKFGWADLVHAPESATERDQQTTEPAAESQATTERKGDA